MTVKQQHYIYHIPGRKVGCTRNIEKRKVRYLEIEGKVPLMLIKEIIIGTSQEAGDREWYWADKFGYPRGVHYSISLRARKIGSQKSISNTTPEQFQERGRKGGIIGGRQRMRNMTNEQLQKWIEAGASRLRELNNNSEKQRERGLRTASKKTFKQHSDWGCKMATLRIKCPHCGKEDHPSRIHRWHLNNCPSRPPLHLTRPT